MIGTKETSVLLLPAPARIGNSEELARQAMNWVVDPPRPPQPAQTDASAVRPKASRGKPRSVMYDLD